MDETSDEKHLDKHMRLSEVYLSIISRYRQYIEEKEDLSVAELPTLVTPKNQKVTDSVERIKSGFGVYSYDKNFHDASIKAFELVKKEIDDIVLPVQFWITPEEALTFRMGDSIDKNILLCSMLISLGNPSAKVLVRMHQDVMRIFVYYEFNGGVYELDLSNGIKEYKSKEEMISSLGIGEETIAYEFNNQMYADIF
jgi:hypothetical protein